MYSNIFRSIFSKEDAPHIKWWKTLHDDSKDDLCSGPNGIPNNPDKLVDRDIKHLYGMFKDFKHFKYVK